MPQKKGQGRGDKPKSEKFKLAWKTEATESYQNSLERKEITLEGEGEMNSRWKQIINAIKEAAEKNDMMKRTGNGRPKDDDAWLGDEFKIQRTIVFSCLKELLRGGGEAERSKFQEERAKLRKMTKEKTQENAEEKENEVRMSKGIGEFWLAINNCRPRVERKSGDIPGETWIEHMGKLLGGTDTVRDEDREWEKVEEWHEVEALDKDISSEELNRTLKQLKNGKAAGEDEVTAEFLKNLPESWKKELWRVTQNGWETGTMREGWQVARIFPIHKGGGRE